MKNLDDLLNEVPIVKATVGLYQEFYQYLKTFPQKDQHMLGRRCEEYALSFFEFILSAVAQSRDKKRAILEQASAKLDVLKYLIRTSKELKMLDNKKYALLESRILEIGMMLGGWIRSL